MFARAKCSPQSANVTSPRAWGRWGIRERQNHRASRSACTDALAGDKRSQNANYSAEPQAASKCYKLEVSWHLGNTHTTEKLWAIFDFDGWIIAKAPKKRRGYRKKKTLNRRAMCSPAYLQRGARGDKRGPLYSIWWCGNLRSQCLRGLCSKSGQDPNVRGFMMSDATAEAGNIDGCREARKKSKRNPGIVGTMRNCHPTEPLRQTMAWLHEVLFQIWGAPEQ